MSYNSIGYDLPLLDKKMKFGRDSRNFGFVCFDEQTTHAQIGTTAEMLSQAAELNPGVVCISALPPFAVNHARALYTKLRTQSPDLHIVVCL